MIYTTVIACMAACWLAVADAGSPSTPSSTSGATVEATTAPQYFHAGAEPKFDIPLEAIEFKEDEDDEVETLIKELRNHQHDTQRGPDSAYRPVGSSQLLKDEVEDETEQLINEMRKRRHGKSNVFITDSMDMSLPSNQEGDDLITILNKHRNDAQTLSEESRDDLIDILNKHKTDRPRVTEKETVASPLDQDGQDLITILNKHKNDTQPLSAALDSDDLIEILNIHRTDRPMPSEGETEDLLTGMNTHKNNTSESSVDGLITIISKHHKDTDVKDSAKTNDKIQVDSQPEDIQTVDAEVTSKEGREEHVKFDKFRQNLSQNTNVASREENDTVSKSSKKDDSGLFSDDAMTVIIAVAASASGLLLLLLVVVLYHCCRSNTRALQKKKELSTLNKDCNRWDPQVLRPPKESLDAFMFGPPIPSVSEMFSNAVLQINTNPDTVKPVLDSVGAKSS